MRDTDEDPMEQGDARRNAERARQADRHVANRIRERRITMGMSQHQLADLIGVTYQQAHKYESGANRISVGRLYDIAKVFNVRIAWFFEGFEPSGQAAPPLQRQRLSLELMRSVAAIGDPEHLEALGHMARVLSTRRPHENGKKE